MQEPAAATTIKPNKNMVSATPLPPSGSSQHDLPAQIRRGAPAQKHLRPFNTKEIKVLLLENVNELAVETLKKEGYQVEFHAKALPEELLKERIQDVHAVGIRSKTQLTADVLKCAKNLMTIGCFCIGTNQVDLDYAASRGIAVFNSPFSNSRSVAEMTIANIINLARQLGDRNNEVHRGVWNKISNGCYEIRGKKLGIVGYGHIGSQLSVLAEAMGMNVFFYDILQMMPLGCATPMDTLEQLLAEVDFVTLHVPSTPDTNRMIGATQLATMKTGSYLINASRGNVVIIPELAAALRSGHLAGAAIDVYPTEPRSNSDGFESELRGCANVMLSPHIGGSTEEAQTAIGQEVSAALLKYINNGTSLMAVNFPEVDLRGMVVDTKGARLLHVHHNVPGVLKQVNRVLAPYNIEKQICDSKGPIAYLMVDVNTENQEDFAAISEGMYAIPETIIARILY